MGILFTIFVSWAIGIIALLQFLFYMRKRDVVALSIHLQSLFFSIFWLVMGVVWVLAGASNLLIWLNSYVFAYQAALLLQLLVAVSLCFALLFFIVRFPTQRLPAQFMLYRIVWFLFVPLFAFIGAFAWFVMRDGLVLGPLTFFAHRFLLSPAAQIAFGIVFAVIMALSIMYLFQGIIGWRIARIERRFILFAAISFLLLGVSGAVEELLSSPGVLIPAARLLALIAAMAAYIATTSVVEVKSRRKELLI